MDRTPPRLQDLPPKWARFCLGVQAFARDSLGCDFTREACVVGCSGGVDSTALLLIAAILCRRSEGGRVIAAHLDHGLRAESGSDAAFVSALCENWNISLVIDRQDVAAFAQSKGVGLEEAGRDARYALFERVRAEHGAALVLVAHQLNDLAEDQLLRMTRGAGWPSLGGMAGHDPARKLLRPLLLTPKDELERFLRALRQPWAQDATNLAPVATRNRMRLNVVPQLVAENPGYLESAARLWRQARCDEIYWDEALASLLAALPRAEAGDAQLLPAAMLDAAPQALRLRLFKAALEQMGPGQPLADSLFRLDQLWLQKASGKRVRFPGDKEARIGKPGVTLAPIDRKKECG